MRLTTSNFIFQLNTCGYNSYVTCSLTRRWFCRLQLLLALVSPVILRSESRLKLLLVLASPVILRSESRGTHHHISLSQIRNSPNLVSVRVRVILRPTVSRPVCLGIISIWGLRPDFYYYQTTSCLLMWGALSDERTSLSFAIAPGPRQHSHFRVHVPWDS
jgi:hypothetical protein